MDFRHLAPLQILSEGRGGCWCGSFTLRSPRSLTARLLVQVYIPPTWGSQGCSPLGRLSWTLFWSKGVVSVARMSYGGVCASCPHVPHGSGVCCVLHVAVWPHLAPSPGHLPSRWTASKGMVRSGPAEMPYSCLRRSWAPRAMTTKWPGPVGAALSCSPGGGGQWADQVWTALASSRVVNTHVGTSAAVRLKT